MDIAKEFLKNQFSNLINVLRWSGMQVIKPENDAMHTFMVQSMILQLTQVDPEIKNELDIKEACYRALLHDLDEAKSHDIVRTLKYANPEIKKAISDTQSQLMRADWDEELCTAIDNSKDDGTPEAIVVNFFDTYSAYIKMRQEINLGNQFMRTQLVNCAATMQKFDFSAISKSHSHTTFVLMRLRDELLEYAENNSVSKDEPAGVASSARG